MTATMRGLLHRDMHVESRYSFFCSVTTSSSKPHLMYRLLATSFRARTLILNIVAP